SGWSLFPNPATTTLYLSNNTKTNTTEANYQILDLTGRVVQEAPVSPAETRTEIDISTLRPAVYLIRVQDASGVSRQFRFVKVGG
ncbi:MAG: T9SS type A sorting domain-containing protein, partial [Bacteroidia bacterium]